jgi:hypothetical protein
MDVNDIAVQAGLITSEYNGFDRTSLTPAERKFAELLIGACTYECKQSVYDAMSINLDYQSSTIEFDRGFKSGRKFGAMDCVHRLVKSIDTTTG